MVKVSQCGAVASAVAGPPSPSYKMKALVILKNASAMFNELMEHAREETVIISQLISRVCLSFPLYVSRACKSTSAQIKSRTLSRSASGRVIHMWVGRVGLFRVERGGCVSRRRWWVPSKAWVRQKAVLARKQIGSGRPLLTPMLSYLHQLPRHGPP